MKKALITMLILSILVIPAVAFSEDITEEPMTAVIYVGSPYITVNGVVSELEFAPFISEGNVMIPIRSVIEAMGGTVDWRESIGISFGGIEYLKQMIVIRMGWRDTFFWIGERLIYPTLRDFSDVMDIAPIIIDGKTAAPVRPIMEAMEYSVEWNADEQSITIRKLLFEDSVIGTVNGESICLSDFNLIFNDKSLVHRSVLRNPFDNEESWLNKSYGEIENIGNYLRDESIREAQRNLIAMQKAEEYGIDAHSEEISAEVQSRKQAYINNTTIYDQNDDYQRELYACHITDSAVERGYLHDITAFRLSAALAGEGGPCYVSEDEVGYTDENYIKIMLLDMEVFDESSAEAAAEVQRRLDAGESFEALYDEYNSSDRQFTVFKNVDTETEENFSLIVGEPAIVSKQVIDTAKNLGFGQFTAVEYEGYKVQGHYFMLRLPLSYEDDAFNYLRQNMQREKLNYVLDEWLAESEVTVDYEAIDIALNNQE